MEEGITSNRKERHWSSTSSDVQTAPPGLDGRNVEWAGLVKTRQAPAVICAFTLHGCMDNWVAAYSSEQTSWNKSIILVCSWSLVFLDMNHCWCRPHIAIATFAQHAICPASSKIVDCYTSIMWKTGIRNTGQQPADEMSKDGEGGKVTEEERWLLKKCI